MTTYIFVTLLTQNTKVIRTEKMLRFQSNLQVRLMRINSDNEVVLSFNEDVRRFDVSEDRLEVYISMP